MLYRVLVEVGGIGENFASRRRVAAKAALGLLFCTVRYCLQAVTSSGTG